MALANMKFIVDNEADSKKLQDALFKDGYSWHGYTTYKNVDAKYLFAYKDGSLSYTHSDHYFNNHDNFAYSLHSYVNSVLGMINTAYTNDEKSSDEIALINVLGKLYAIEEVERVLLGLTHYKVVNG